MKDDRYTPPRVIVTFTLEAGDQGNYVTDDLRNWVYSRFQVLPSRLIGHFSQWNIEIGPGNVDIKIEDRRPWWRRVFLGALLASVLMVGCVRSQPVPVLLVPSPFQRYDRALLKCYDLEIEGGDTPSSASEVDNCIRPVVKAGRLANVADCEIQTSLVMLGCCKTGILSVLAQDTTPQTHHSYDECEDFGDPCDGKAQ